MSEPDMKKTSFICPLGFYQIWADAAGGHWGPCDIPTAPAEVPAEAIPKLYAFATSLGMRQLEQFTRDDLRRTQDTDDVIEKTLCGQISGQFIWVNFQRR